MLMKHVCTQNALAAQYNGKKIGMTFVMHLC